MPRHFDFHLHADNIVECERTLRLMEAALKQDLKAIEGPAGSPVCPRFVLHLKQGPKPLAVTFFPGFGRWNEDILKLIRDRGGTLREAADAVISGVSGGAEQPLLAIEYCGALPAGNQAWQRNGRAYSFGLARIPYLYVAELGGFELDKNRNRKAARMPNPAVPFSYLAYSIERSTPIFPVFITSPGADSSSRTEYGDVFAEQEIVSLVRAIMLCEDTQPTLASLREKVLAFVKKRAASSRAGETLTPSQWAEAHKAVANGTTLVAHLLEKQHQSWSKTAYIAALTRTARALMDLSAKHAVGLSSTKLPICVVPRKSRGRFATAVKSIYPTLPAEFATWLQRNDDLVICWVMGFKPHGDDARPDRGLPPFTRMLAGQRHDLLTVVYGPARAETWPLLVNAPHTLAERNGLWEAILDVSDALLVDTDTDNVTNHGFVRANWDAAIPKPQQRSILVSSEPQRSGENDVDTVLHTLFSRHAGPEYYEGMCNPPGGDWSGISLQPPDRSIELRWLSLPRISGEQAKRPDHVFQIFGLWSRPIILPVESKETAAAVERQIGPRLVVYLQNLIAAPASVERRNDSQQWKHSNHRLNPQDFVFMSAVAFIPSSEANVASVSEKAEVDLILAFNFGAGGESCNIRLIPRNEVARRLASDVSGLDLAGTNLEVRVANN